MECSPVYVPVIANELDTDPTVIRALFVIRCTGRLWASGNRLHRFGTYYAQGVKMGIFQEYMNSKGTVEKGKVDISGDRTDPMTPPNKPPGDSGQKPYSNSDGKSKKGKEKGFGEEGDKDLVFNYDTKGEGKKPAKIPTAEQRFAHTQIVPLVCESVSKDPLIIENIVREMKQNGLLHILVAELMEHRETYKHLAQLMKDENYGP